MYIKDAALHCEKCGEFLQLLFRINFLLFNLLLVSATLSVKLRIRMKLVL